VVRVVRVWVWLWVLVRAKWAAILCADLWRQFYVLDEQHAFCGQADIGQRTGYAEWRQCCPFRYSYYSLSLGFWNHPSRCPKVCSSRTAGLKIYCCILFKKYCCILSKYIVAYFYKTYCCILLTPKNNI